MVYQFFSGLCVCLVSILFALVVLVLFALVPDAFAGDLENPERMETYFGLAGYVVMAASILANKTKTDKDDKAVSLIGKAVNFLAGNWWRIFQKKGGA